MAQARGYKRTLRAIFEASEGVVAKHIGITNITGVDETAGVVEVSFADLTGDDLTNLATSVGKTVELSGCTNSANDGAFLVTAYSNTPGSMSISFANANGVDQVGAAGTLFVYPQAIQLAFEEDSLGGTVERIENNLITGNRYDSESARGNHSVGGNVNTLVDQRRIGHLLKLLLGAPTTTSLGGGLYQHVFEPGDSNPSMLLESGNPDVSIFRRFSGCKVNTCAFSFATGQNITANFSILGATETKQAVSISAAALQQTISLFHPQSITLTEGGATVGVARTASLNVDNQLAEDTYVMDGTPFRDSLPETGFKVDGELTLLLKDAAMYEKALNGAETSLSIEATDGDHSIKFEIFELQIDLRPFQQTGKGPVEMVAPFMAYYEDGAEGVPMRVTLVNDVSSY